MNFESLEFFELFRICSIWAIFRVYVYPGLVSARFSNLTYFEIDFDPSKISIKISRRRSSYCKSLISNSFWISDSSFDTNLLYCIETRRPCCWSIKWNTKDYPKLCIENQKSVFGIWDSNFVEVKDWAQKLGFELIWGRGEWVIIAEPIRMRLTADEMFLQNISNRESWPNPRNPRVYNTSVWQIFLFENWYDSVIFSLIILQKTLTKSEIQHPKHLKWIR